MQAVALNSKQLKVMFSEISMVKKHAKKRTEYSNKNLN